MSGDLEQLVRLRVELDLSSADVATEMGLNGSYVRGIESGIRGEPVGFANRYKVGVLKAIIKREEKAAAFFGTRDFLRLLRKIDL